MERPHEELKTNDGVDDDDEEDEEGDVDEGDDGHEDGVHDDLETRHAWDQPQGPQHSESSESLHIKTLNLKDGKDFTDHAEEDFNVKNVNINKFEQYNIK